MGWDLKSCFSGMAFQCGSTLVMIGQSTTTTSRYLRDKTLDAKATLHPNKQIILRYGHITSVI